MYELDGVDGLGRLLEVVELDDVELLGRLLVLELVELVDFDGEKAVETAPDGRPESLRGRS